VKRLPYYQRAAQHPAAWVRGITVLVRKDGTSNIEEMAYRLQRMAHDRRYTQENRDAFRVLSDALWTYVKEMDERV
jgi:hypothetical protein